ncbi:PEP-CTERM sorting domain-containing protein [Haloferula rosea]|uniref:PEP-CTERM sorting domain-containing protein n=1 Tax=Haloferula rosea TaxID=490093 RepID=A0A934VG70_9BACT|nr:PEP-CTERM sorting domain-containing protein [Haloferula rosea]MBK1827315.1 PEP-CTERM sorting domain-containing protein [Haloferula rosea]
MKKQLIFLCLLTGASSAATLLTPATINGGDTSRSTFTDGNITLNPLEAGSPSTFNDNALRLGIDDAPTPAGTIANNANAFNDVDTNPNNGNEQQLQFIFAPTIGFSQMTWDFSRADGPGPNDGVFITGFVADPGATLSGAITTSTVSYDSGTGTLQLDLTGADFGGADGILNLSNLFASAGQTLLLTVTDTTQHGAQLAITSISYDVVPEPSALALLSLGGLALMRRRRG